MLLKLLAEEIAKDTKAPSGQMLAEVISLLVLIGVPFALNSL